LPIVAPRGTKWVSGLRSRCVVGEICWKPKLDDLGVQRIFHCKPFLFVYFIFYGKNAEVPVDVLVENITWCTSDSSQDFQWSAVYNAYVAAARVPP